MVAGGGGEDAVTAADVLGTLCDGTQGIVGLVAVRVNSRNGRYGMAAPGNLNGRVTSDVLLLLGNTGRGGEQFAYAHRHRSTPTNMNALTGLFSGRLDGVVAPRGRNGSAW